MVENREKLTRLIWECIGILRGHMPPGEYPKYILGMTFLKILHDSRDSLEAQYHWHLDNSFQWNDLNGAHSTQVFQQYLGRITSTLPPKLGDIVKLTGLFELSDLIGDDLYRLVDIVSDVDFGAIPRDTTIEALTSIFEGPFTKSLALHYTSETVSILLAKLANPRGNIDIYDPACGTGRLLLNAYREARTASPKANIRLFGQEIRSQTALLAQILMLIAGVENAEIRIGDTLTAPQFRSPDGLVQRFDVVVSALPFGVHLDRDKESAIRADPRFRDRFTSSGDMLFLEHIVASLSSAGRAVTVVAPGALFRGGVEVEKRRGLVETDLIEAVIELPNGVLLDTPIAPVIIIFNRSKPDSLQNHILVVNANTSYTKYNHRNIIDDEHQQRIIDAVANLAEIDGFARLIQVDEIAKNDYVLLPTTYLDKPELKTSGFLVKSTQAVQLQDISTLYAGTRGHESILKGQGNTPIIQGRDLSSLSLTVTGLEQIRITGDLQAEIYAQHGDILIQRIGKKPRAYLVEESLEGVLVWNTVFIVRLNKEYEYLRHFLIEYLNSPVWYQYLDSIRPVSAGAPTLSMSVLKEVNVPVPPPNTVAALGELYEVELDMQTRVSKLRELKDSLFSIDDEATLREQIRQIAIREHIVVQTIQQAEDFEYQIRNLYPYALAFPYRLLSNFTNPGEKYPEQLRVGENLMAFFGSIGLATLVHSGMHTGDEASWLNTELQKWWQGGISPGNWQEMGRRSSQIFRASDNPNVAEIASVWFKPNSTKPSEFRNNLTKLGEILNDYKHGRGPKTPYEFQDANANAEKLLRGCLEHVSLLTKHHIYQVVRSTLDWKTKQIVVNILVHMGDHPGHRQQQAVADMALPQDHLYIAAAEQDWISLYPLITAQYCPSCRTQETYMVDHWDGFGQRLVLKSFERGHTLDTSDKHPAAVQLRDHFEHFIKQITRQSIS